MARQCLAPAPGPGVAAAGTEFNDPHAAEQLLAEVGEKEQQPALAAEFGTTLRSVTLVTRVRQAGCAPAGGHAAASLGRAPAEDMVSVDTAMPAHLI